MKQLALVALLLTTTAALAQNAPQPDAALAVCLQLSATKERQLIDVVTQAQTLSKQLEEARAELAKIKAPPKAETNQ